MKLLPLSDAGKKLQPKYRIPITTLILACMFSTFVADIFFAGWLSHALNIAPNAPMKDQVNGGLWLVLFLGFFVVALVIGYLMSFAILAAILRWWFRWPSSSVSALMFESRIPPHWFKDDRNA